MSEFSRGKSVLRKRRPLFLCPIFFFRRHAPVLAASRALSITVRILEAIARRQLAKRLQNFFLLQMNRL